jgi:hypothetical protein
LLDLAHPLARLKRVDEPETGFLPQRPVAVEARFLREVGEAGTGRE